MLNNRLEEEKQHKLQKETIQLEEQLRLQEFFQYSKPFINENQTESFNEINDISNDNSELQANWSFARIAQVNSLFHLFVLCA